MKCVFFAIALSSSAALAAEPTITLTPIELSIPSHKWEGRSIETSLNCAYESVIGYLCGGTGVFMRFQILTDDPSHPDLSPVLGCGKEYKLNSVRCLFNVRFVYASYFLEKLANGGSVTNIKALQGVGLIIH